MLPKSVYEFALPDEMYRMMHEQGMFPKAITCPECGAPATFRNDTLAARFECIKCEHAVAAMYADCALAEILGDYFCPPFRMQTCPECGGSKVVRLVSHRTGWPVGAPGVCGNEFHAS